jgi:hypothetical protein
MLAVEQDEMTRIQFFFFSHLTGAILLFIFVNIALTFLRSQVLELLVGAQERHYANLQRFLRQLTRLRLITLFLLVIFSSAFIYVSGTRENAERYSYVIFPLISSACGLWMWRTFRKTIQGISSKLDGVKVYFSSYDGEEEEVETAEEKEEEHGHHQEKSKKKKPIRLHKLKSKPLRLLPRLTERTFEGTVASTEKTHVRATAHSAASIQIED